MSSPQENWARNLHQSHARICCCPNQLTFAQAISIKTGRYWYWDLATEGYLGVSWRYWVGGNLYCSPQTLLRNLFEQNINNLKQTIRRPKDIISSQDRKEIPIASVYLLLRWTPFRENNNSRPKNNTTNDYCYCNCNNNNKIKANNTLILIKKCDHTVKGEEVKTNIIYE